MLKHIAFTVVDPPLAKPGGLGILCMVDGPGATWRLSFELPLRRLRQAGDVRLAVIEERAFDGFGSLQAHADFSQIISDLLPDVVVLSRCNSPAARVLIEVAAQLGLPIVFHLDDDLFAVPKELGKSKFDHYNSPGRLGALRTCCERADLIYCSTEALCHRLGRFGFSTPMIFGDIYCPAPEPFAAYAPREPRAIGYMGTSGHRADLDMIVPAIAAIMTSYPDLRFEVLGTIEAPQQLKTAFPGRVSQLPGIGDYDSFLARMRELRWAVALAPLKETSFNAVKANTKFIEYAIAGMPAVVSSSRVYAGIISGNAGLAASSAVEWVVAIDRLLKDLASAQAQVERAQARLRRDFSVDKLEKQVMTVLGRVIDAKRKVAPARRVVRAVSTRSSEQRVT